MPLAVAAAIPRHRGSELLEEENGQRTEAGRQRGEERDPENLSCGDQMA